MQRSSRAVATAAVVAGLGGLAAIALGSQPGRTRTATTRPLPPLRVVRTQVEVHTITRVKRDLPPAQPHVVHPVYVSPSAHATPVVAPAPAPVVRQAPAPRPLRTRSSGGAGGHGGDDGGRERGDGGGEGHGQDD